VLISPIGLFGVAMRKEKAEGVAFSLSKLKGAKNSLKTDFYVNTVEVIRHLLASCDDEGHPAELFWAMCCGTT
jgi:hypothetical protein